MNKDAAANSPVVTPVPPPANDINSNNHAAVKSGEEPMETNVNSKHTNDVNAKLGAVKTEVIESSRGIVLSLYGLLRNWMYELLKELDAGDSSWSKNSASNNNL